MILTQKSLIALLCSAVLAGCLSQPSAPSYKMDWGLNAKSWRFSENQIIHEQANISFYPGRNRHIKQKDSNKFPLTICVSARSTPTERKAITFYGVEVSLTESGKTYTAKLDSVEKLTRNTDPALDPTKQEVPETADIPPDSHRCYYYSFNIKPFDETEIFDISIKGMQVGGVPFSVPTVRFHTTPAGPGFCFFPECFISH